MPTNKWLTFTLIYCVFCGFRVSASPSIPEGQSFSIVAGSSDNTPLGVVQASDTLQNVVLQNWQIVGGSGQGLFAIDAVTGQLRLSNHFLLGTPPISYDLNVQVSNGATASDVRAITISVLVPPISISAAGYVLNRRINRVVQQITLRNTSQSTVVGPIRFVLDHISSNTSLGNSAGSLSNADATQSSYIIVSSTDMQPAAALTASLEFLVPSSGGILYSGRVVTGGLEDTDGDGIPDWQDAFPADYYNGITPTLSIVGGNNQSSVVSTFNTAPFDIAVWNHAGTAPLINAPVVFQVLSGSGLVALTSSSPVASTLAIRTDVDGTARSLYRQPTTAGVTSTIAALAGNTSVSFQSFSLPNANVDSDGNGLSDSWEREHFGHIGLDPGADPDGDGLTNAQEMAAGLDPNDFFNGEQPVIVILSGERQSASSGWLSNPVVAEVRHSDGQSAWGNAPVRVGVEYGDGEVKLPLTGSGRFLSGKAGSDGRVAISVYTVGSEGLLGFVQANSSKKVFNPTQKVVVNQSLWSEDSYIFNSRIATVEDKQIGFSGLQSLPYTGRPVVAQNKMYRTKRTLQRLGENYTDVTAKYTTGGKTVYSGDFLNQTVVNNPEPTLVTERGTVLKDPYAFNPQDPTSYNPGFEGVPNLFLTRETTNAVSSEIFPLYPAGNGGLKSYWRDGDYSQLKYAYPNAPTEWTPSHVKLVNGYTFSIDLSDEDTAADVASRFASSKALADAIGDLPMGTMRTIKNGGGIVQDAPSIDYPWFHLYNANALDAFNPKVVYGVADYEVVVPEASRVPGVGYRIRFVELFYSGSSTHATAVASHDCVLSEENEWRSPVYRCVAREGGETFVTVLSTQPIVTETKSLSVVGAGDTVPVEYSSQRPVFSWSQAIATDKDAAWHYNLVGSKSLQQIDLFDPFYSAQTYHADFSMKWLLRSDSTAAVRLWGWRDDGTALGKWTSIPAGADLTPYLVFGGQQRANYLFAELVAPGEAIIEFTTSFGGASFIDDVRLYATGSISMAVDADRDQTITLESEGSSDVTSADKPYRFWVNSDNDKEVTYTNADQLRDTIGDLSQYTPNASGVYEIEQDDVPVADPSQQDWHKNVPTCKRDLEDFTRLVISTQGLTDAFKNGDLYMGLKWTDTGNTHPSIKLYKQYDAAGGLSYVTDDYQATMQLTENAILNAQHASDDPTSASAHTTVTTDEVFVLPQGLWFGLSGDGLKRSLLFEGCTAGTGQLKIVILKRSGDTYTEIGEGPGLWMDLKEPHEFVERWSCGDGDMTDVGSLQRIDAKSGTFATPSTAEEKDYILYVHGYNMKENEKQSWLETTYKRLWHFGYKGRVGGFSWPCAQTPAPFDNSEYHAWQAAAPLNQLLTNLKLQGFRVHLLAHSQGNIVAGEALRQAGPGSQTVATYIASQAAVPAHMYDSSVPARTDFTPTPPDVYSHYWLDGQTAPQSSVLAHTWPASNPSYMASTQMDRAAVKYVNFWHVDDFALTGNSLGHPGWMMDQRLKNDINYTGYSQTQGFFRNIFPVNSFFQFPAGRYLIFSSCAPAWSRALGATQTGGVFAAVPSVDLKTSLGYGTEHIYHSAEFRSSLAQRYRYWLSVLDACVIQHTNP